MLASPCVYICQMDKDSGFCIGCFRTIDEITAWSAADNKSRARILKAVASRREDHEAEMLPENPLTPDHSPHHGK